MKKYYLILTTILGLTMAFSSCSHRLVGTWALDKYAKVNPGEQAITLNNIGTMTFDRKGEGKKDIRYTVLGVTHSDTSPFTWSATDKYVTLESPDSDFSKTWIIITNRRKFQKWQSTDGSNNVQTIELSK